MVSLHILILVACRRGPHSFGVTPVPGAVTLRDRTEALNQRGIRSARGGRWHVSSVMNLLARARDLAPGRDVAS